MNMRAIAARAGVSSATISRVLNGSPLVRPETARRVQAILDEVNFIPNPLATTLKYGRSKTFGLIIPDICNPFFSEFMGAFEQQLAEMDHEVLFTSVQTAESRVLSVRRMLMRQVDGAVIMTSEFDAKEIEPLLLRKVPLVTLDRGIVRVGCSDVSIDYEAGFVAAVGHLHALGHTRIGYIGGIAGIITTDVRRKAFERGMQVAGLHIRDEWTAEGNYRVSGGERAIQALMQLKSRPTAIVTANDLTAFGALRGANKLGFSVPADLAVVGLDDILLSEVVQPPLTTVRIPRDGLARVCIEALNYTKENVEKKGRSFSVEPELVIRESTALRSTEVHRTDLGAAALKRGRS